MKKIYIFLIFFPILFFKYIGLTDFTNIIFYLIILFIFLFSNYYREIKLQEIFKNLKLINKEILIDGELNEEVIKKDEYTFNLYKEYKKHIYNNMETIDSYKFFNIENYITSKINMKLYSYIPNLFLSIGILGTFLGLALGLRSITSVDIFSESQEIISFNIKNLLFNVSTSFYTSLYGIYYSILYTIFHKHYINEYENEIYFFNNNLKKIYENNIEFNIISNIDKKMSKLNDFMEKMIKIFEKELRKTLNLVFNDEYVTEMNKIQKEFILNSNNLINVQEENMNVLKEIEKLSLKIFKLNENIEYISNKFYTKEKFDKYLENINNVIDKNIEYVNYFDDIQYKIAETIKKYEKTMENGPYNKILEISKKIENISEMNKEMIEKYYKLYSNSEIHEKIISKNISSARDNIEKLNENVEEFNKKIDRINDLDILINEKLYHYDLTNRTKILDEIKEILDEFYIKYINYMTELNNSNLLKNNEFSERLNEFSNKFKKIEEKIYEKRKIKNEKAK